MWGNVTRARYVVDEPSGHTDVPNPKVTPRDGKSVKDMVIVFEATGSEGYHSGHIQEDAVVRYRRELQ